MRKDIYDLDLCPPHPGEILRDDLLSHLDISKAELARHLGISTLVLRELLTERRCVTLDLARRLGCAFGQGTRYWLGLQIQYDIFQAENEILPKVAPLPVRSKAMSRAASPRPAGSPSTFARTAARSL